MAYPRLGRTGCLLVGVLATFSVVGAQQIAPSVRPAAESVSLPDSTESIEWKADETPPQADLSYRLGSGDEITISVLEIEDLQMQRTRIGSDGLIALPLVGRIQASGFTVRDFTKHLEERLSEYLLDPRVAVNVVDLRSQPVSVLGSVNQPGVHQLQGRKSLVEILSLAGGIRQDAGYQVRVTRRAEYGQIPVAGAAMDSSGEYSIAEIPLDDLTEARNPAANIEIKPHDVISVPAGKMVYAVGAVARAGGFVLSEREDMSVLELLALAGGVDGTASKKGAAILRPKAGSAEREEIPINLKDVMKNEGSDLPLYAGDILFVPESGSRAWLKTAVGAGLGVGTSIAVWRLGRR